MTQELHIEWQEVPSEKLFLGQPEGNSAQLKVRSLISTSALSARTAQLSWRATSLDHRLACVRRLRWNAAAKAESLARALAETSPPAEFLAAQLIPFLDACRFLEKDARKLLEPRVLHRAPLWLWGCRHEIRREPHGLVLVLAPSNYPFFLPAVQVLQALAAGNGVLLKPGTDGSKAAGQILALTIEAGFPAGLVQVLNEDAQSGSEAAAFADKIILTGSVETGEKVLAQAARSITPCTMELSGCDAVFILPDADLSLAARSVAYGLALNHGRTCIAPRRIFVWQEVAGAFRREFDEALRGDAVLVVDDPELTGFGESIVSLQTVSDDIHARREHEKSPFRLGASIFSRDTERAGRLAGSLDAGSVCVNDLIVPTADGRLPFGGRGQSGFGVTRGAEGLLEMTRVKVISQRRGRFRPHLQKPRSDDFTMLSRIARILYGSARTRWQAIREMARKPKSNNQTLS